jgi:hypothetical protein
VTDNSTQLAGSNEEPSIVGHHAIDLNTGFLKRDRLLLQNSASAAVFLGFGERKALYRLVAEAEQFAKQYDPNESRDENGRWIASVGAAVSLAVDRVGPLSATSGLTGTFGNLSRAPSIFGEVGPAALEALGGLAVTFATGATAFLGAYFLPLGRRSAVDSGTLPGHPDITYHYDGDMGHFTLYNSDHELLFTGITNGDGVIRTQDGDAIGRRIDGTIVMDSTILPDETEAAPVSQIEAEGLNEAQTEAQAKAEAIAGTQPQLCPDPLPDRPGYKSPLSMAYQQYVNTLVNPEHPLSPGLAVYFFNAETGRSVAFDDCYATNGIPVDAKGYGLARMIQNTKMAGFLGASFTKQAARQVGAAAGRPIDWYVAEPGAANFFRTTFAKAGFSTIHVIDAPMPVVKLFIGAMRRFLGL